VEARKEEEMAGEVRPSAEIRRFDIFAEYKRLEALGEGRPPDEAKGYGLWVAKVVASRRFGSSTAKRSREGTVRPDSGKAPPDEHAKFQSLGDEVQTDELFDKEVVQRMGEEFYARVFSPAVSRHFEQGDSYESVRDSLRKEWNG
jgi:hypothetical protein